MVSANIFDAKTNFSRYIAMLEDGSQPFIIIKKGSRPVAKLIPYDPPVRKLGIARGKLPPMESVEAFNSIDTGLLEGDGSL